ncbi:hypothetical protein Tco_0655021, partial [Tanacetum coccineum]
DLNSSRLRVLKCLLDDRNSRSDDRYAVSNGSGYAVLICWDDYVVLDRKLDTPYPIEVDTPYSTVDQDSRRQKLDVSLCGVYCDNHDLSRLDNQSIERDRLIGIGFVLDFVEFISFTFGDKEMISVIEVVLR